MLTDGEGKKFWEYSLFCDKPSGNCWSPKMFADAKRIIGRALYLDPVKGVDLFMQADRILKGKPPGYGTVKRLNLAEKLAMELADPLLKSCEKERNLPNCQSIKELEQFGLARGPSLWLRGQELLRLNIDAAVGQLAEVWPKAQR